MTVTTVDQTETGTSRRRFLATRIVAILFAAVAAFGVFLTASFLAGSAEHSHQIHELSALILVGAGVGAAFVRIAVRPLESAAAVQQVLAISVLAVVAAILAGTLDGNSAPLLVMAIIMAAVAPTAWAPTGPKSTALLAGAAMSLAFVPYAIGQIQAQTNAGIGDPHAEFSHYTSMAAFALVIVALAYLATTKAPGWRIPGWAAGVAAIGLGVGSLLFDVPSALSTAWAVVTVLGGIGWLVLVEREARTTT